MTGILTLDFETLYDKKEYSLSKMTTESYIRDPRFEVIGVSVMHDEQIRWFSGTMEETKAWLLQFDWQNNLLLAHNCVTGDHEVRTREGWVRFDQLRDGVEVMQWDPNTERLTWTQPTVIRKVYNGPMLNWDSQFHKGIYTPDHRLYVKTPATLKRAWSVRTAQEVSVSAPNNTYIPAGGYYEAAALLDVSPLEGRLLELTRADGNIQKQGRQVRFKFKRADKISRCCALLDEAGVAYRVAAEPQRADVTCIWTSAHSTMDKIIALLGRSNAKGYGEWVLDLPISTRSAILDEVQYWDGHRSARSSGGNNRQTIVHSAKRNDVYWINEMACLTNKSSKAKFDLPNDRGWSRSDGVIHQATIRTKSYVKTQYRPEEVAHSGMVYCLQVPTQAFIVRRQGVTWVTGNCAFDAAILNWHFGIKPKGYLDTMSMANALHGINESVSLANLAKLYGLPDKGTEVHDASGKRRLDFTPEELAAYGEYCRHDVWLCRTLFDIMMQNGFPKQELKLVDLTIRMFAEPMLEMDGPLLEQHLIDVREGQAESLNRLATALGAKSSEEVKDVLMSNNRFAELLRYLGVDPPMKISPTTGKEAYAFAKTDEEFTALLEHENVTVQAAVAARLGNKTTIEESRTDAFLGIAQRGTFPFPLKYSGAQVSHRWSGFDVNPQNLGRDSQLRASIKAPKGYKIVAADLSNIELRLGLWLAGQEDKLDLIRQGRDLYMDVAATIYGKTYEAIAALGKKSKERTSSKVVSLACIAEGSPVLTQRGLVPIEKILLDDCVWDGVEWVSHEGVIYQGERDVITYQGLTATPDHKVWAQDGRNLSFGAAKRGMDRLATTGDGGAAVRFVGGDKHRSTPQWCEGETLVNSVPLPLWKRELDTHDQFARGEVHPLPQMCDAGQGGTTGHAMGGYQGEKTTAEASLGDLSAVPQRERSWVCKLWWSGYRSAIQIGQRVSVLCTEYLSSGGLRWLAHRSRRQQRALLCRQPAPGHSKREWAEQTKYRASLVARGVGISPHMDFPLCSNSNTPVCAHGDDRGTDNRARVEGSASQAQELEGNKKKVKVYDIVNAGPRHRFTVSGVLVSNCIYGTGATKLRDTLRIQGKVKVTQEEAQRMTDIYRGDYTDVVAAWQHGKDVLDALYHKQNYGEYLKVLNVTAEGMWKPGGLLLAYPDLRWTRDKDGKMGYTYEQKRKQRDRVYGSKVFQRDTQSLARDIIGEHMLKIDKKYRVVGTVHDEIICLVPEAEAEAAGEFMLEVMRTPPVWAPDLPLDAEVGIGDNYLESK